GDEETPAERAHAEHGRQRRRRLERADLDRAVSAAEVELAVAERCQALYPRRLLRPRAELDVRGRVLVRAAVRCQRDPYQPVRVRKRKCAQEQRVDGAEDRGVGSYAERQRQGRERGECGIAPECAEAEAKVLEQSIHVNLPFGFTAGIGQLYGRDGSARAPVSDAAPRRVVQAVARARSQIGLRHEERARARKRYRSGSAPQMANRRRTAPVRSRPLQHQVCRAVEPLRSLPTREMASKASGSAFPSVSRTRDRASCTRTVAWLGTRQPVRRTRATVAEPARGSAAWLRRPPPLAAGAARPAPTR